MKIVYISVLLLGGCLFLIASCASSRNSSGKDATTPAAKNDTLPKPPKPAIAPGYVRLEGQIISYCQQADTAGKDHIHFKVASVKEYGSSTPVVAAGDTLVVDVSNVKHHDIQHIMGRRIQAVLSHQIQMDMPEKNRNMASWTLVKFEQ